MFLFSFQFNSLYTTFMHLTPINAANTSRRGILISWFGANLVFENVRLLIHISLFCWCKYTVAAYAYLDASQDTNS